MDLKTLLRGTGVALVTPFKANLDVDYEALGRVIEYVISNGVEYVVTLGTTGETPTLSKQEKIDIVNYTFSKVDKRVPVVVGIGGNNTREIVDDLGKIPIQEAAAILSASPNYSKPSQEGLFQHYKTFAEASAKPIIIYNVPSRTGRNINASTVLRLARDVENIAGIKEAGGDMAQCMLILRDKPADFLVVSGDDALAFPQIAMGMDGVISVAANSFPKKFSEMVRTALRAEIKSAKLINDELIEGYEYLFIENNPAGVKAAMSELGLIENYLRLPLVPLSSEIHASLRAYVGKL